MKLFKVGSLAALLVPVGIVLAAGSFFIDVPVVRIVLQALGFIALCVAAWQGQCLVNRCQTTLDEI
jgi:hypothetical protein